MSDTHDRGITVTPISAMDQPIDVNPETTVAFIGRTLRGPLNTPVLVHHFGEFRRRFGDCPARSGLGAAVRDFFQHGGRNLVIVRVANNARGALACLPAAGSALVLRSVEPGSAEHIRCAVDYDGIDDSNDELFNLTVQRLDPDNGLIADQEIWKGLSPVDGAETFAADVLLSSTIVRVEQPYPTHRPNRTTRSDSRFDLSWIDHAQDGTDGAELSDYDLIGSRSRATGLFALQQVDHFDVLYLPPCASGAEPGPAAILAAELYCRKRGAMLIVDPPADAASAEEALSAIRERGYASPSIFSYFPRVRARGDDDTTRAAGGAIAGLFCKLDRNYGCWQSLNADDLALHRSIRPSVDLDDGDCRSLVRAGINPVRPGPAGRARINGSVTLSRGSETDRAFVSLPVRRAALQITNTIDLATRWTVFEKPDRRLTARIRQQIFGYFERLYEIGALATDRFFVHCDAGLARQENSLEHGVTIVLGFHIVGSERPMSITLHQSVHGCRVASTAFAPVARDCA